MNTSTEPMTNKPKGFKEPFCAISHLAGAVLSAVGLVVLLIVSRGQPVPSFAYTVYGISLIALYSLSTLYHAAHVNETNELVLQRMDHIAIFLLIAGTYTPVCLVSLVFGVGWKLFAAVWSIAALGIAIVLFWRSHPHWVRVTIYILMGWLAVIALPALMVEVGAAGIAWMVGGGLVYTLGIIFYAMDESRPRPWLGKRTPHDIWHLFVLGGSACHYILVLFYICLKVQR